MPHALLATLLAFAQSAPLPTIPAVTAAMRPFIDAREVAGAVTLVATADRIAHRDAVGQADLAAGTPMRPDAIFWIASMSKPVTAAAVMMMQDEGKLSVEDDVAKHLPEFRALRTADGRPAKVTIRHLLTHTALLGEATGEEVRAAKTLAEIVPVYVRKPVAGPPGERWVYSQSAINTAARVVEVRSGLPFDQFLQRRLFAPLGMKDTTFYLSPEQVPRLAKAYRRTDRGGLEEAAIFLLDGKSPASRDRFPAANGGLFSTADDYVRFCQMVLRGGERGGRRLLSAAAVKQMTTVQTGGVVTGFTPGNGWGLGWCVVREPQGVTAALSAGTFGHGGAYGTQAWVDPVKGRIDLLLVQRANFPNGDASPLRRALHEAAARP